MAICSLAIAQGKSIFPSSDSNYTKLHVIQVDTRSFTTDVLQNVYVINSSGELIKYGPAGKKLYAFSEFSLGAPKLIDATNPFLVLLYYPDYQTVISLDNTLAKTGEFALFDLDLLSIEAICFSNDGNIWFYDPVSFKMKKIDRRGKTLLSSNSLNYILEETIEPNFLLERGTWLYVNDPEKGVLVFDLYGQYTKTLPIEDLNSFQVIGNNIIYFKEKILSLLNLDSFFTTKIALPQGTMENDLVRIEKNRFYLAREGGIWVFKF